MSVDLKEFFAGVDPDNFEALAERFTSRGYTIIEIETRRPWGGYIRLDPTDTEKFLAQFFPGLSADEARLGIEGAELSPKLLVVRAGSRFSWQYHHRRTERWMFLTPGYYKRSLNDEEGEPIAVEPGDYVQFAVGERHRIEAGPETTVLAAEIWQHVTPEALSDESDVIRLSDDYNRK